MDLQQKLKAFVRSERASNETPGAGSDEPKKSVWGGEEVFTDYGTCCLIDRPVSCSFRHGRTVLEEARNCKPQGLQLLTGEVGVSTLELEKAVFLDTETTGLAGGTGTYAFLVGCGFFRGAEFVVRQYVMRDFPEELAMLECLQADLSTAETLVTYNGRRFDWPLLRDRFLLSRIHKPPVFSLHLDLLSASRRLWRHQLPNCSLQTVEKAVLGVRRGQDIPGAEVPQRYFDYLQSGDGALLDDVLHHNTLDILSLASLYAVLSARGEAAPRHLHMSSEAEGVARLHAEAGRHATALSFYTRALDLARDPNTVRRLLLAVSFCYKRLDKHEEAAPIWRAFMGDDPICCEELAKYYEHRLGDPAQALRAAQHGLQLVQAHKPQHALRFRHRIARLQRRAAERMAL